MTDEVVERVVPEEDPTDLRYTRWARRVPEAKECPCVACEKRRGKR